MLTHNRRNYGSRPPRGFRRCHHPGPSSTPRRASSSRPRSAPSLRAEKILLAAGNLAHGLGLVLDFTWSPPRGRSVAYRRATYFTNSIYYRIDSEGVEIIRVLGRQDPEKQL